MYGHRSAPVNHFAEMGKIRSLISWKYHRKSDVGANKHSEHCGTKCINSEEMKQAQVEIYYSETVLVFLLRTESHSSSDLFTSVDHSPLSQHKTPPREKINEYAALACCQSLLRCDHCSSFLKNNKQSDWERDKYSHYRNIFMDLMLHTGN